jgi:FkbM family methyltransferase
MFDTTLTEREKDIYNRLCDEESQQVFNVRKQFALTKNEALLADIFVNKKQLSELVKKINGKTYVIYGAQFAGFMLIRYFNFIGISNSCVGIWDNNPSLQGKSYDKHTITAPKYEQIESVDVFLISTIKPETTVSITNALISHGVREEKIATLEEFGAAMGRCGFEDIVQYFDKDIIIPRLVEGEIFVDAGCCNFATSSQLLKVAPSVKSIYAFEPDPENMQFVLNGIGFDSAQDITKVYDFALWSGNEVLGFWVSDFNKGASGINDSNANAKVQGRKLDDIILPADKVSFIKMDIEGSELEALKGAAEIIKRDKPKLAISVYHKMADYVDLAEYICSLVPSYKLFMRHYTPCYAETVLYCVI